MSTESSGWTWVRSVTAGFLFVTGLATLAVAGNHPAPRAETPVSTQWVPPSMHVAEAGVDVGPGSDEALLVSSPEAR